MICSLQYEFDINPVHTFVPSKGWYQFQKIALYDSLCLINVMKNFYIVKPL